MLHTDIQLPNWTEHYILAVTYRKKFPNEWKRILSPLQTRH